MMQADVAIESIHNTVAKVWSCNPCSLELFEGSNGTEIMYFSLDEPLDRYKEIGSDGDCGI